MDRARQIRIAELRLALAGLPPDMREDLLAKHCATDPSMLEEIRAAAPAPRDAVTTPPAAQEVRNVKSRAVAYGVGATFVVAALASGSSATAPPASPPPVNAVVTSEQPTPLLTPYEHAKSEILELVKKYCAALETLKVEKLQPLFNVANASSIEALQSSFKKYRALRCTLAPEPPEFVMLDMREFGEGKLKFKMRLDVQMRGGGAPRRIDTLATMEVSRRSFQSRWLIDRVTHEQRPK